MILPKAAGLCVSIRIIAQILLLLSDSLLICAPQHAGFGYGTILIWSRPRKIEFLPVGKILWRLVGWLSLGFVLPHPKWTEVVGAKLNVAARLDWPLAPDVPSLAIRMSKLDRTDLCCQGWSHGWPDPAVLL